MRMTRNEFIIQRKAFEEGMISAWRHILNMCNVCVKAHRKEMTKKQLNELAEMNAHLWKSDSLKLAPWRDQSSTVNLANVKYSIAGVQMSKEDEKDLKEKDIREFKKWDKIAHKYTSFCESMDRQEGFLEGRRTLREKPMEEEGKDG